MYYYARTRQQIHVHVEASSQDPPHLLTSISILSTTNNVTADNRTGTRERTHAHSAVSEMNFHRLNCKPQLKQSTLMLGSVSKQEKYMYICKRMSGYYTADR